MRHEARGRQGEARRGEGSTGEASKGEHRRAREYEVACSPSPCQEKIRTLLLAWEREFACYMQTCFSDCPTHNQTVKREGVRWC